MRTIVALLSLLLVGGCTPFGEGPTGVGASPAGTGGPAGVGAPPADTAAQLAGLSVAAPHPMTGYDRIKFPTWLPADGDCDTRDAVLKRDGTDVRIGANCKITGGTWVSPYDGKTVRDPDLIDIDHVVPLAAAWRSGADHWTGQQREQFANDLTRPQLIAASRTSNRQKGDKDPSEWKPPNRTFWCEYAQRWVAVKAYWQLSVTPTEKAALGELLATCR